MQSLMLIYVILALNNRRFIFLDLSFKFENEYLEMKRQPWNVKR